MSLKHAVWITSLFAVLATPSWALDLGSARTGGMVAEARNGYVVAVTNTPQVQSLIADINSRRRAEYARISGENGQPADVVARLAFEQIVKKLPSGALYESEGGGWKKR